MKKIESYPPLKAIEVANRDILQIWDEIERARAGGSRANTSPLWREDIYITAWQVSEDVLQSGNYEVKKESLPYLSKTLAILSSWRRYKEVYRFAPVHGSKKQVRPEFSVYGNPA